MKEFFDGMDFFLNSHAAIFDGAAILLALLMVVNEIKRKRV